MPFPFCRLLLLCPPSLASGGYSTRRARWLVASCAGALVLSNETDRQRGGQADPGAQAKTAGETQCRRCEHRHSHSTAASLLSPACLTDCLTRWNGTPVRSTVGQASQTQYRVDEACTGTATREAAWPVTAGIRNLVRPPCILCLS